MATGHDVTDAAHEQRRVAALALRERLDDRLDDERLRLRRRRNDLAGHARRRVEREAVGARRRRLRDRLHELHRRARQEAAGAHRRQHVAAPIGAREEDRVVEVDDDRRVGAERRGEERQRRVRRTSRPGPGWACCRRSAARSGRRAPPTRNCTVMPPTDALPVGASCGLNAPPTPTVSRRSTNTLPLAPLALLVGSCMKSAPICCCYCATTREIKPNTSIIFVLWRPWIGGSNAPRDRQRTLDQVQTLIFPFFFHS